MKCSENFIPNNIHLREVSSLCIAKYKNSQAFALSQLSANAKHVFSKSAKEILLLQYDIWFQWLITVETMLRENIDSEDSIANEVIKISDDYAGEYKMILLTNPLVFDEKFSLLWLEVHSLLYVYLQTKIKESTTKDAMTFMVEVTDVLISVMNNTLFELHEIDAVFNREQIFVSFDDLCLDYDIVMNKNCLLIDRLKSYSKFRKFTDVIVKDYSSKHDAINNTQVQEALKKSFADSNFFIQEIK